MKKLLRKIVPSFIQAWHWKHYKSKKVVFENKTPEEVFTTIYEKKFWGDEESVSGVGSSFSETRNIATALPKLLKEYNVTSMLDVPCGDFHWMKNVDLAGVQYTGADIVAALAEENNQRYQKENIRFRQLNLITDALPKTDLIFCRDCLVHLSEAQVKAALQNIKQSGSRYLLTTTFTRTAANTDIVTGNWRALNLQIAPFNLPTPITTIRDTAGPANKDFGDKVMALWDITTLP